MATSWSADACQRSWHTLASTACSLCCGRWSGLGAMPNGYGGTASPRTSPRESAPVGAWPLSQRPRTARNASVGERQFGRLRSVRCGQPCQGLRTLCHVLRWAVKESKPSGPHRASFCVHPSHYPTRFLNNERRDLDVETQHSNRKRIVFIDVRRGRPLLLDDIRPQMS